MKQLSNIKRTILSSRSAQAHWYILLITASFLFLAGLALGGYRLWEVYTGEFFTGQPDDISATTVSRQEVEEVNSTYEERKALFERAFSTPAPRDPS